MDLNVDEFVRRNFVFGIFREYRNLLAQILHALLEVILLGDMAIR